MGFKNRDVQKQLRKSKMPFQWLKADLESWNWRLELRSIVGAR